ncbi:MAG: GNAT family N-acetyltransferase [Hyphomicrobiaceae bacterium]
MTRKATPPAGSWEVSVADGVGAIDEATWDRLANPDPKRRNPTLRHAFFRALEGSGSISPEAGWLPQHLLAREADGPVRAILPLYLKAHSFGEYVFDQGWAEAYERHGLDYYPKLLSAVPVTPVPGRRFLTGDDGGASLETLATAIRQIVGRQRLSSAHVTFLEEGEADVLSRLGWLLRTGQQFHWPNAGYGDFEAFLGTLASRKRKALRRERREALSPGLSIEWLSGRDITEAHWDAFFAFYTDTGSRKWGAPYLNRTFFSLLGEAMSEDALLVMCRRDGRYVAGALNLIGGDALYGRYWGCIEAHPFLHFEVCYYQAIDFAIHHKLARVEAGAGGDHKLVRGYVPAPTYSAHWIADPRFRHAIDDYLVRERRYVAEESEALGALGPYRRGERS